MGGRTWKQEIKKKEQTMMCAENLKINEMRDKKINSQTTRETKRNNANSIGRNNCCSFNIGRNNNKFSVLAQME